MSKATATALVNQFVTNPALTGRWPNIHRVDLGTGLLARIDNPNSIDQAATPFCGPTTVIRALALNNPDAYAQAAIDLYTTGHARINNLDIRPGSAVINAAVPANTNPADWIMLASLRDSSNWLLSASGFFGRNIAGITIPSTIETWFRNAGFTQIVNRTSLTGGDIPSVKSMNVQQASQYYSQGYTVAMLIDADLLDPSTQNDMFSMYPDHWIVLASPIANAGSMNYSVNTSFKAFTWGTVRDVPQSGTLVYERFLTKFYGFVAARL
jgi:hypothetical protein